MTMKEIPTIVRQQASKQGFNSISFAGEIDGSLAFSVGCVDSEGIPVPMGFPTFILLKDDKTTLVSGLDGLDLLDSLK